MPTRKIVESAQPARRRRRDPRWPNHSCFHAVFSGCVGSLTNSQCLRSSTYIPKEYVYTYKTITLADQSAGLSAVSTAISSADAWSRPSSVINFLFDKRHSLVSEITNTADLLEYETSRLRNYNYRDATFKKCIYARWLTIASCPQT